MTGIVNQFKLLINFCIVQLTITNLQYGDAGNYECQGINDEAMVPIRRSFSLTIESDPWWVVKPTSVDAAENETATFTCIGESIPHPTYFWYLNGVPITKVNLFIFRFKISLHTCTCQSEDRK